MDNSQRPFITTGEIVKIAGVHPNTVAMWRLTGKIIRVDKIGASFLYDRATVMEFLEKRNLKKEKRGEKNNE